MDKIAQNLKIIFDEDFNVDWNGDIRDKNGDIILGSSFYPDNADDIVEEINDILIQIIKKGV